jgi:4-amino-4-deoxy-L-arabinose transferase-like glycosyltransferase
MLPEARQRVRIALFVILLAAALARLPAALYMGDQVSGLPGIHDQVSYDALARSLLAGRGYSFPENWYPFTRANTPTAHWSFIYPPFLAAIYAVAGYHPLVARIVQAALGGALTSWLIYRMGRRLGEEAVGLAGAALAAGYGYFIYYNAALMTETFFIVSVLASLYLALELAARPSPGLWLGLGLALGLASLLRQTMLLFAPVLLLYLVWALRRRVPDGSAPGARPWHFALPVAVIGLMILPWTARNYVAYGEFLLLNSNAGYAFYASNNPNLATEWDNDEVVVPVPDDLRGQNEARLNSELTRRGLEFITADPERYARLTLTKALEYFKFWPSSGSRLISNLNRVLSFGLVLPFMLFGLYLSLPRWRSYAALYLFAAVHTGIHLLTWPAPRYRLPVDAVLMVFAGLALVELARQAAGWRRRLLLRTTPGYSRRSPAA